MLNATTTILRILRLLPPPRKEEKARAHLKADGIDEEYQTKLLEEVEQMLIDGDGKVAHQQTDKQHPGQPERNSAHPNLAQTQAERDHQGQNHH